jgi:hypothetical protein
LLSTPLKRLPILGSGPVLEERKSAVTGLQRELGRLSASVAGGEAEARVLRGDQARLGSAVDGVGADVLALKWRFALALPPAPAGFASLIVADFPAVLTEFRERRFVATLTHRRGRPSESHRKWH